MGYVGATDYASYKKMWVLCQWRYFAYIMMMCISSRKAGKDAMGHHLAAAMVGLSLNEGYNFSKFIQLLINDALPNLPAIGEIFQVKRVDKRVFAQFLKPGSVEPTPVHTPLFGHLINKAYVAPDNFRWYSPESEPEPSEHGDEQQEEEEVEGDDESDNEGDVERGSAGAKESDSEATESDSSDSDDAPDQSHPRRTTSLTLPESSSKRKRQESTSSEYEPKSVSDVAIPRHRREIIEDVSTASTSMFDFDAIFSSPLHTAEASASRDPDPRDARITTLETNVAGQLETVRKSREDSKAQQAQINSLVDEVTILRSQRTGTEERLKNVLAQKELMIKTNNMILGHWTSLELWFDMQQREHEMMVKKQSKPSGDEVCHPVDLTKDDDKDKDPEAGSSGSEQQALAIVPISAVSMAEGELTHQEGGDASGSGGEKGKSAAEVLNDLSDEVILLIEPDYSKGAQIDALSNLEEGELESDIVEVPKGDGEGVYELEDGEIFEAPDFEADLNTGSDQAPVWQKTSIIDKHGATSMILSVRFDDDKKLFAIKRAGRVQYLKPTSEAFSSLPKYDLVNLANRELLCDTSHASAMGLWRTLQKEGRSGNFKMFKPQMPERVRKWKLGAKGTDQSFDEITIINFSVKDLTVLNDKFCINTDEWTKLQASRYNKLVKFCLDYKLKMEAKAGGV
ncbi:hypothetical protein L1987_24064 [Smallanthus sonchifolius]|uniref:Uncharacterized protein n=1 Tax=Smallanthus sonchifolius TaxID=185202 RepID=A0ACB9IKU8_9ASTR|nr:hypothetical protein L1987_24064 [Smallanthus sonchifolius]